MANERPETQKEPAALLDVQSVADLLDCSPRHIFRLAERQQIPEPVRLGRMVRWRRGEIQRWIENGCPAAGGEA